jgi:hypothetical protein
VEPLCVTAKPVPAMFPVADRADVAAFCVHDTVTELGPFPPVGDTVSHEPLPEALQLPPVQPAGEPVTMTFCDPATADGLADVGVIEKLLHVGTAAPAWFTPKAEPATVALPDRDDVDVFCAQDTITAPDPLPLVGDTVIHEPLPLADQLPPEQPEGEPAIVNPADPASAVGVTELESIEKLEQLGGPAGVATTCRDSTSWQ